MVFGIYKDGYLEIACYFNKHWGFAEKKLDIKMPTNLKRLVGEKGCGATYFV